MARQTAALALSAVLLLGLRSVVVVPDSVTDDDRVFASDDDGLTDDAGVALGDAGDDEIPTFWLDVPDPDSDDAPGPTVACRGRYCFDASDVLAAFRTVGPRTRCVATREMGPALSPNSYGSQGEVGPVQLHPRGKLPEYLRTGMDPWNPYEAIPWLEQQLLAGQGGHWSPVRLGLC